MPMMRAFGKRMMENKIKPEYECFEMGHLDTGVKYGEARSSTGAPMQFNLRWACWASNSRYGREFVGWCVIFPRVTVTMT